MANNRKQDDELFLVVAAVIIGIPVILWFLVLPAMTPWGLRNGFFTNKALLLAAPGTGGAGPTVTTWTILLAASTAIGCFAFLLYGMLSPHLQAQKNNTTNDEKSRDKRRPTPSALLLLIAAAAATYSALAAIATPLLPQPIPAAAGLAAAIGSWLYLADIIDPWVQRQAQRNELEWQLLNDLGYDRLPPANIVTVTKWTTDELANPDDDYDADPAAADTVTTPDIVERPSEFTLRYTGRRNQLPTDIRSRISKAARGRFNLTWDIEDQLITATAAPAEPQNVMRLRNKIVSPRLFKAGAFIKDINFNPGGGITGFTVHHRIADELAGNDAATNLIERRVSELLPGRWRAAKGGWDNERDRARFEIRPELSKMIPADGAIAEQPINNTLDQVCAAYDEMKIAYAMNEDKDLISWVPKLTPHILLTGPTGTGKTGAIHTIAAASAYFGVEIYFVDFKGMEFNSFQDYPNVVNLATEVHEAVAIIDYVYRRMRERYKLAQRNSGAVKNMAPILLVIDEYTEFQDRLDTFWKAHKPAKNAPRTCPTLDKVSSILRLGRTARVHVMAGLQRPDVTFLKGEARDNFTHRISLGKLSSEAAQMIWGNPWVGRLVPLGIRGRGNARDARGEPVEVQVFYTPDPKSEDPEHEKILAALRPPTSLHERRVIFMPPNDPDLMPPAKDPDPSRPIEGDFAYYEGLPIVAAAEYPQLDPLSPLYKPPAWLAVHGEASLDEPRSNISSIYRLPTPATAEELTASQTEGATERDVAVRDLTVGDYTCIDPGSDIWATITTEPIDLGDEEEGMAAFIVRHDRDGHEEEIQIEWDEQLTVKELREFIAA